MSVGPGNGTHNRFVETFEEFTLRFVQYDIAARGVAAFMVQQRHKLLEGGDSTGLSADASSLLGRNISSRDGDESGDQPDMSGSTYDASSIQGSIQSFEFSDNFSVLDLSPFGDVNDNALRAVAENHPNLSAVLRIDLSGCSDVTGDGFLNLIAPHQNIKSISLRSCNNVTDKLFQDLLPRLANLEYLDLTGCSQLTDLSLGLLALECPRLRTFLIDRTLSTVPTDIAVVSPPPANAIRRYYLSHASGLRKPSFDGDDSSLDQSAVSETLCLIDLSPYSDVNDEGMRSIAAHHPNLSAVSHINLSGCCSISDAGFMAIFTPEQELAALNLSGCNQLSDAAILQVIHYLSNLEFLDLTGCSRLTDASICKLLTVCLNLEEFAYEGTQATLPPQVVTTSIGELRRHYVFGVMSPNKVPRPSPMANVDVLPGDTEPHDLDLSIYHDVHDEAVFELAKYHPNLAAITYLNLIGCSALTEAGLGAVMHPQQDLRVVNFSGCLNLTDGFLLSRANTFMNVEHIDLTGCVQLTDASIGVLALKCPRLDTFLIEGTQASVPNASMAAHASAIRRYYLSQLVMFDSSDDGSMGSMSVVSETLTHFDLTSYPNIDDMTLRHITEQHSDLAYITHINLGGCSLITDLGFDTLFAPYQNVIALTLKGCMAISDSALRDRFQQLRSLEFLDLTDCAQMTDETISLLVLSCEALRVVQFSGTRATFPGDHQNPLVAAVREYYAQQESPAEAVKRQLLLESGDFSMHSSSSVQSLKSTASSSLLEKVRTPSSASSIHSRPMQSDAALMTTAGSIGAASAGAGRAATGSGGFSTLRNETAVDSRSASWSAVGQSAAGRSAAEGSGAYAMHGSAKSAAEAPSMASSAPRSVAILAPDANEADAFGRTDRSGSIASALSMDAELLPRADEGGLTASAPYAAPTSAEMAPSRAVPRRDSGRNQDEIRDLKDRFAAERAALERRLHSMQTQVEDSRRQISESQKAPAVNRSQPMATSMIPPSSMGGLAVAPAPVQSNAAAAPSAQFGFLLEQQRRAVEQAFDQEHVTSQMQEMNQQSEFLRERVREARQMITDSRDLTQQLGVEVTLSLKKQKEAAETAVGVLEFDLRKQKDENDAMQRRMAILEERVAVAEASEIDTKRLNVSIQGRVKQLEEIRARQAEELEKVQHEVEVQQKLHADQHSELSLVLREKEDMEERYSRQDHNMRERHVDEMRRQAAIHSVKMERLRTGHAAEMAKVLEEHNASKSATTYSEEPPSWFTELFSAQLLRLQQTAGYREYVPGVTSVSREGLQELLNSIIFPCVLGKGFEQVRERVSSCPSDFQAKELWKLVHEGGAVAARPGVLKFPSMRPPSNNMTPASEPMDRMSRGPPSSDQPMNWGAPAGPEYVAAPAPMSKKTTAFGETVSPARRSSPLTTSAGVYPTPNGYREPQAGDHIFSIAPKSMSSKDANRTMRTKQAAKDRPWTASSGKRGNYKNKSPPAAESSAARPSTADPSMASFRRGGGKKIYLSEG